MPRERCYDVPEGDTVIYDILNDQGFRLCKFMFQTGEDAQAHFDSLPNLKVKQDDMIVCSYPKTGTNWVFEMLTLAMTKTTEVSDSTKMPTMLELCPEIPDNMPSPRLLNSHLSIQYLPKDVKDKKLKVVLVCRNPKDVAVSFYNHTKGLHVYEYDGKFENYLQMFMRGEVDYGSYPEYLLEFQQFMRDNPDIPVHIVYYEDLKENCFKEMKKVLQFLNIDLDDDKLKAIVENCSMKNIKAGKIKAMDEKTLAMVLQVNKGDFNIYRKGQVGDWKNWFTVAQSEAFDSWWKSKTEALDMFTFRYVLK